MIKWIQTSRLSIKKGFSMQELSTIMLHPPSSLPGIFPTYPSFAQGEFTITSVARVSPHPHSCSQMPSCVLVCLPATVSELHGGYEGFFWWRIHRIS